MIKKNTYRTCERSIIAWNQWKGWYPGYLYWNIIIFHSEKFPEMKTDFLHRFIMGNVDNYLFPIWNLSHLEYLAQYLNFFIGYFHVWCNDSFIFVMCWNLVSYRGRLKREILKFFILINISHFKYLLKIFASLMFTYNVLLLFNFKHYLPFLCRNLEL